MVGCITLPGALLLVLSAHAPLVHGVPLASARVSRHNLLAMNGRRNNIASLSIEKFPVLAKNTSTSMVNKTTTLPISQSISTSALLGNKARMSIINATTSLPAPKNKFTRVVNDTTLRKNIAIETLPTRQSNHTSPVLVNDTTTNLMNVTTSLPASQSNTICGCPQEAQCTCEASLKHLACLRQACANGCSECSTNSFKHLCNLHGTGCARDLQLACGDSNATCGGSWRHRNCSNDLSGLRVHTERPVGEPYCGRYGHCLGELQITATIRRPMPGVQLQCALPRFNDTIEVEELNWRHCTSVVFGEDGICSMPMVERLERGTSLRGKCWLVNDNGDQRLTNDSWFLIGNHYESGAARINGGLSTAMISLGLVVVTLFGIWF